MSERATSLGQERILYVDIDGFYESFSVVKEGVLWRVKCYIMDMIRPLQQFHLVFLDIVRNFGCAR